MHGIGADRYVYFYLAVEVRLGAGRLHIWFHTILYDAVITPLTMFYTITMDKFLGWYILQEICVMIDSSVHFLALKGLLYIETTVLMQVQF